jgi:RNA polymerase sigma factor (sigma-70 family)
MSSATAGAQRPDRRIAPRGDEAALYANHHERLWRAVRRAVDGPDTLIDDACQTAWLILLRRQPDQVSTLYGWLVTVAIREAWREHRAQRRQAPLGEWSVDADEGVDCLWIAEPSDPDARIDARIRLAAVAEALPERKRRLVGLRALGFSYREIGAITGDTHWTVNRQLTRAERRLDALREPLFA